jgi:hypothetical protein
VTIGCYTVRRVARCLHRLVEELLGAIHIPMLAESDVHEITIPVDGAIQIRRLCCSRMGI